jgi:hypothetical protein
MLYIISKKYSVSEYILSNIKNTQVEVIFTNDFTGYRSRLLATLSRIESFTPVSFIAIRNWSLSILNKLKQIKTNDTILLWDIVNSVYLKTIAKTIKAEKKNIWYWNPLVKTYSDRKCKFIIQSLKRYYTIFTFDEGDALKYKINFKGEVHSLNLKTYNDSSLYEKNDFYFLGQNKGRTKILDDLQKYFMEKKYNFNFIIYPNGSVDQINYEENLINVIKSKCIVDIVQDKQAGLTIRVLEAAFYKKKLLTNNKNILNSNLYHKENIFILDYDNLKDIDHFMESDFFPIPDNILEKYDINHWVLDFL